MSASKPVHDLDDSQLRGELGLYGFKAGPISKTTRPLLRKKLSKLRSNTSMSSNINMSASFNAQPSLIESFTSPVSQQSSKTAAGDSNERQSNLYEYAIRSRAVPSTTNVESSFNERGMNFASTPKKDDQQALKSRSTVPANFQRVSNRPQTPFRKRVYETEEEYSDTEVARILSPAERLNIANRPLVKVSHRVLHNLRPPVPSVQPSSPKQSSRVSKWLISIFGSIVVLIVLAYVFMAYRGLISHISYAGQLASETVIGALHVVYNFAIFPVIVLILIGGVTFGAYSVYKKYKNAQETQKGLTMKLVDRIAEHVRSAGVKGVFELHLRDTLFPPTRRTTEELKIWSDAVKFLNNMDSRIRSKSRLINGVESNLLMWVTSHECQDQHEKLACNSTIPTGALPRCLKICEMNYERFQSDGEVKRSVYMWLRPVVPIHFALDNSAVYMMFSNSKDAKNAFDKLSRYWYQGRLVKVKFLTRECYTKRFPQMIGR